MIAIRVLLAALALLVAAPGVSADQNDPRLPALFEALKAAPGVGDALPIEDRIWTLWLRSNDALVDGHMERGMTAMARGDFGGALAAFDDVVHAAPDFAEGWNKRATASYLVGDFAASVRDIGKTLGLEPKHFGALSGLGLIYLAVGSDAGALKAFEKALEIHPFLPGAKTHVEELRRRLAGNET